MARASSRQNCFATLHRITSYFRNKHPRVHNRRRRTMPTFKRADQEQLEKAKDLLEAAPDREIGFVKSLYYGRLKLDQLMPYPQPDADEMTRVNELIGKLEAFLKAEVDPDLIDREQRIPQH